MPTPTPVRLLDKIHSPADVKALALADLPRLAEELREEIISSTAKNGGHVGPNLGVVELTIALHRIFSTPEDQIVFDVSHQGYVHKMLTGRLGPGFHKLRQTGGVSGFLARNESEHDAFGAGHAGTALSAALGMATARDLRGSKEHVIAVCGDAAFTCGITMEALNNVMASTKRFIIILNDNEWSIARNVGAMARYLTRLSTSPTYNKIHNDLEKFFTGLPHGPEMHRMWTKWKRETKDFFAESMPFEKYGLRYLGPIDGHNFDELIKNLEFARQTDAPVIVHVLTKKGRGLNPALNSPEKFHGVGAFDPSTGNSKAPAPGSPPNYQDVFGSALARFAKADPKIVGITAAMTSGTGLSHLAAACPRQLFDVGIAEEHAVLFAAGLATKGFHPVVAIYSTFMQRSIDQILHDVCLQELPVTFCMDRSGLSPNDGPTHHGLFDISLIRPIPNAVLMQPANEDELVDMLHTALKHQGPAFIRYPRGAGTGAKIKEQPTLLKFGKAEVERAGNAFTIWALGPMVAEAEHVADMLAREDGIEAKIVNARFAKPIDSELLIADAGEFPLIVTMEDHVLAGGFGSAVLETLQGANISTPVERIGWPDTFIEHGSNIDTLRTAHGLGTAQIAGQIRARLRLCGATRPAMTASIRQE